MENHSKRVYNRNKKPVKTRKKSSFSLRQNNKKMSIVLYAMICIVLIALTCVLNIALYNNSGSSILSERPDHGIQLHKNSSANSNVTIENSNGSSAIDTSSSADTSSDDKASSTDKSEASGQTSSAQSSSKQESSSAASSSKVSSESSSSQATSSQNNSSSSASSKPEVDKGGYMDGSIFIYDNAGYELFYGTNSSAKNYASAISEFKNLVGSSVNVYNLVVPNHSEYGIPEKYRGESQYDNLNTIFNSYTADVKGINIYNAMKNHSDEYIYFNTDHHWTALGAYYGYTQFAKATGAKAISLSETKKDKITGFEGSLINATGGNSDLMNNLDTVYTYEMPGNQECMITSTNSGTFPASLLYPYEILPENAYSVFIWGDNPYMTIKTDVHNGKKIMVVKESYGNAFVPFLAANYEEIYVVDFRYYTDGIVSLVNNEGIDDVLFLNGIVSANNVTQVQKIKSLFY